VFSALGPIIFFLENNCIPVNKLTIATYPKAMPINEHVVPMRISANINLPPAILVAFIYAKIHYLVSSFLRNLACFRKQSPFPLNKGG
jgi:hypothetical protein